MLCNYCGRQAELIENKFYYKGQRPGDFMLWICKPCRASVRCHKKSTKPMGTLAKRELRCLRKLAKDLFIETKLGGKWNCSPKKKKRAYIELRERLGLSKGEMHFGLFDEEMCLKIIRLLTKKTKTNR